MSASGSGIPRRGRIESALSGGGPDDTASSISLGELANYIGFRMRRVHDIQAREFLRLTRDENLTQGMFTALALISANAGSSQAALAQEMGLHTSAMVSLIDDLEKRQWVIRQKSLSDRRRYRLVVTPAGEKALHRLLRVLDKVEANSLQALTPTELKVMTKALDKLYGAYRATPRNGPVRGQSKSRKPARRLG